MDFAKQLWQTYLQDHSPKSIGTEIELLRGDKAREALWWFAKELSARHALLNEIPFDENLDEEADGALANLALTGDRKSLAAASLGAWHILEGRWLWFMTAMLAAEMPGAGARAVPDHIETRARLQAFVLPRSLSSNRRPLRRRAL